MSWLRLIEQRMKEMEKKTDSAADPADPVAAAEAAKPPRMKNRILHLLSEMWPAYLIEVVVIILGISITLVLEEWRDSGREEKLEKVYLGNLIADIDADQRSLLYAMAGTDSLLAQGEDIRKFLADPVGHPLSAGQLDEDVRGLIARPKFISHDATFSDLKSSGNLHLLKDVSVKRMLFDYYSAAENIRQNQDAEQAATIMLSGRFFLQWFALDGSGDSPIFHDPAGTRALVKNAEFRNHVLSRVGTRTELMNLYRRTDSIAHNLTIALGRGAD